MIFQICNINIQQYNLRLIYLKQELFKIGFIITNTKKILNILLSQVGL
nr:MAG TPA: hypothetical protein [Caudoviricetes sp.]